MSSGSKRHQWCVSLRSLFIQIECCENFYPGILIAPVLSVDLHGGDVIILVTGATGHIGNALVRKLLNQGENVRALTINNNNSNEEVSHAIPVQYVCQGSLADEKKNNKASPWLA